MEGKQGATVAIAHTNEKHRSQERVLGLVREAIDLLGGISQFIKPGQTVLIKPNQTVYYSAEEGCTTDPLVVGALIRLAKEAGAGRVQVAESSGGFFSSLDCMKITGMAAIAQKEGAELIDLGSDKVPNRKVPIPGGRVIQEVPLPEPLLDADVIIDAAKAKNHHIEPISGTLKNWVGTVNQNWREYNHGDEEMIGRFMDIMMVTRPALCVVDALIAGEGDGPIADLPHWCGCILASTDPVATDVTICRLLGHDWQRLNFAREAEARGLGVREPIHYVGVPLEQVSFQAWPGHKGYDYLPVNFLVGGGVSLPGTIGHVKSVLDSMLRRGELTQVMWLKGTPTIMIGEVEDPNFEEHLKEGPYIVFDDAALPKYKNDPRVYFVPGHPVLRTAMPELMKGLGVEHAGKGIMKWQQFQRWGIHNVEYGTLPHKLITIAKPLAAVGLIAAALTAATTLMRSQRNTCLPEGDSEA
ncbi:MAG TPA: DUF362 domain-containing protein [Chthonomonadaceae bacterium]|nr:DUF362 domain-containing protein [Chthonomonadaceae bacterium]